MTGLVPFQIASFFVFLIATAMGSGGQKLVPLGAEDWPQYRRALTNTTTETTQNLITVYNRSEIEDSLVNFTTLELGADILLENTAGRGQISLTSKEQTSIVFDGMGIFKVDGQNAVRCFYIAGAGTITVRNLMISKCNAKSGNGGGLYVSKAMVVVSRCTVSYCTANAGGGARVFDAGQLYLESSWFYGNVASNGALAGADIKVGGSGNDITFVVRSSCTKNSYDPGSGTLDVSINVGQCGGCIQGAVYAANLLLDNCTTCPSGETSPDFALSCHPYPSPAPTHAPSGSPTLVPSGFPTLTTAPTTTPSPTAPTIGPTPAPSRSYLPTISLFPTHLPTVTCIPGQSFDGKTCSDCPIGKFVEFTNMYPWPQECTSCPYGEYQTLPGQTQCLLCVSGKISSPDRSFCQDCYAGEYVAGEDIQTCEKCPMGQYAPQALKGACLPCSGGFFTGVSRAATTCTACAAGQWSPPSSVNCTACAAGTASSAGASVCGECILGFYAASTGSSSCSNCDAVGPGYTSLGGSKICDICRPGFYWAPLQVHEEEYGSQSPAGSCEACVDKTRCQSRPGNNLPAPMKGYWLNVASVEAFSRLHVERCPRLTCKGSDPDDACWDPVNIASCDADNLLCETGSSGPLCGACTDNYVYTSEARACVHCPSQTETAITIVVGIFLMLMVCGLSWALIKGEIHLPSCISKWWVVGTVKQIDSGTFRILWCTYQIGQSIFFNFRIDWPDPFPSLMRMLAPLTLEFVSLKCFQHRNLGYHNDYTFEVSVYSSGALCVLLLNVAVYCARKCRAFWQLLSAPSPPLPDFGSGLSSGAPEKEGRLFQQHVAFFVYFTFLVLPPVSARQFKGLDCVEVAGEWYLRDDTSVNCSAFHYRVFRFYDFVMIAIYLSIPSVWLALLYRENRSGILGSKESSSSPLHCLFGPYRRSCFWFEAAEMHRRIFFVGILPLISSNGARVAACGLLASICCIIVSRETNPFANSANNILFYIAQQVTMLTYAAALVIETNLHTGVSPFLFGVVLVCVNLVVIGLAIAFGAYRYYVLERRQMAWRRVLTTAELRVVLDVMDGYSVVAPEFAGSSMEMTPSDANSRGRGMSAALLEHLLDPSSVSMTKRLGAGAFGEVFKGTCLGHPVAIKTILNVTEDAVKSFRAEVVLTATLRHPNIVNFVGACWGKELICLVLEWVARGSLGDLLADRAAALSWEDPLLKLTMDVARGMAYLHAREFFDEASGTRNRCIIHRDLKPDNILVTEFMTGKIADFGTARAKAAESVIMSAVGTPLFVAPEIMRGSEAYDEKVDVYSFGLLLLDVTVEEPLVKFLGKRWMEDFRKLKAPKEPMRLVWSMQEGWRPVTPKTPLAFAPTTINALIVRCCAQDPTLRPSFDEILQELGDATAKEIQGSCFQRQETRPLPEMLPRRSSGRSRVPTAAGAQPGPLSGLDTRRPTLDSTELERMSTNPMLRPARPSSATEVNEATDFMSV